VGSGVTDAGQVTDAVRAATGKFGRLDVLVNNAGQGLTASIEDTGPADFRAILDLNLTAPLITMQAVLPVMRAQGGGAIVNVSSGNGLLGTSALGCLCGLQAGSGDAVSNRPARTGRRRHHRPDPQRRRAGRRGPPAVRGTYQD
jgi:NAD(P)-dependent dehydrogenase (short-subunit alcohol dehydrogenase family)